MLRVIALFEKQVWSWVQSKTDEDAQDTKLESYKVHLEQTQRGQVNLGVVDRDQLAAA
jgi:hypothetical protein